MRVAYFIGCYPFINLTFVEREIQALEALGLSIQILSMVRPRTGEVLEEARWRMGQIFYVRPIDWARLLRAVARFALLRPLAFWGTLGWLLTRPHPGLKAWGKTAVHFVQGVYLAEHLRPLGMDHLHAHFADRASVAALVASRLLRIPFSFTAHAKDIYSEAVFLPDKIAQAAFVLTCTRANLNYLRTLTSDPGKVHGIYHGLPLQALDSGAPAPESPPLILAVGKLIEKKGFPYLLRACAQLRDRGYAFSCTIVGEGPDRAALEAQRALLGLEQHVTFPGNRPFTEVLALMRRATLFTLPSVIARNNDRDGIPNVVIEAMAVGVPVVSTAVSAIPEVVHTEVTGLLVPPADGQALAQALARLLDDAGLRRRLAESARRFVREHFDDARNAAKILALFEARAGQAARALEPIRKT